MKNNKIYTLGISCLYHDSSSVLLENDEIVSASQEERFTRNKFENGFPINSINNCIETFTKMFNYFRKNYRIYYSKFTK